MPLLETLKSGKVPDAWANTDRTTDDEVTLLAPLEIATTRGRALPLFGFDYIWEVYKPQDKRRWGYYTVPMLYKVRLVGRLDPKLERDTNTLIIKGFWLEDGEVPRAAFGKALTTGLQRFMEFVGADNIQIDDDVPTATKELLHEHIRYAHAPSLRSAHGAPNTN